MGKLLLLALNEQEEKAIDKIIHPYDTATHKNERGASPVELPSRPFRPFKKINNSNPKIYFERRAANDKQ